MNLPPDSCGPASTRRLLCRTRGADIARLASRFAIAPPEFATTMVGSASAANMTRNIAWAREPIDDDLVREINLVLASVRDTAWPTGRPGNSTPWPGPIAAKAETNHA